MQYSDGFKALDGERRRYFAGANGARGFRGYYDELFGSAAPDRVWILKGGPGTGKSTFIDKIAAASVRAGADVDYLHCGSDPASLDGVIIRGSRTVALADGTSPHVRDCDFPGGRDCIIDLGARWDNRVLYARRGEIAELARQKAATFTRAYKYLAAANELGEIIAARVFEAVDAERLMKSAASTLQRSAGKNTVPGERSVGIQSGVTMSGGVRFDTFSRRASAVVHVRGDDPAAGLWLRGIADMAANRGIRHTVVQSPLNDKCFEGVFISGCDIYYTKYMSEIEEHELMPSRVNAARFVDRKRLAPNRAKLRFASRCRDACMSGAFDSLAEARVHHFALERIYADAMDYGAVSRDAERLIEEILAFIS